MTRARELSKLSNQQTLKIDTTNTRIGIGSTAPSASLDVGQNIYADANSGVLTATKYAGWIFINWSYRIRNSSKQFWSWF